MISGGILIIIALFVTKWLFSFIHKKVGSFTDKSMGKVTSMIGQVGGKLGAKTTDIGMKGIGKAASAVKKKAIDPTKNYAKNKAKKVAKERVVDPTKRGAKKFIVNPAKSGAKKVVDTTIKKPLGYLGKKTKEGGKFVKDKISDGITYGYRNAIKAPIQKLAEDSKQSLSDYINDQKGKFRAYFNGEDIEQFNRDEVEREQLEVEKGLDDKMDAITDSGNYLVHQLMEKGDFPIKSNTDKIITLGGLGKDGTNLRINKESLQGGDLEKTRKEAGRVIDILSNNPLPSPQVEDVLTEMKELVSNINSYEALENKHRDIKTKLDYINLKQEVEELKRDNKLEEIDTKIDKLSQKKALLDSTPVKASIPDIGELSKVVQKQEQEDNKKDLLEKLERTEDKKQILKELGKKDIQNTPVVAKLDTTNQKAPVITKEDNTKTKEERRREVKMEKRKDVIERKKEKTDELNVGRKLQKEQIGYENLKNKETLEKLSKGMIKTLLSKNMLEKDNSGNIKLDEKAIEKLKASILSVQKTDASKTNKDLFYSSKLLEKSLQQMSNTIKAEGIKKSMTEKGLFELMSSQIKSGELKTGIIVDTIKSENQKERVLSEKKRIIDKNESIIREQKNIDKKLKRDSENTSRIIESQKKTTTKSQNIQAEALKEMSLQNKVNTAKLVNKQTEALKEASTQSNRVTQQSNKKVIESQEKIAKETIMKNKEVSKLETDRLIKEQRVQEKSNRNIQSKILNK